MDGRLRDHLWRPGSVLTVYPPSITPWAMGAEAHQLLASCLHMLYRPINEF
ncbi:hypothetical protein DPMN_024731 [Dreissena polymorpha]|uniref:Uncharacterized protein n=1 Tax=Dreissena polymorpha TaxID=45954 RepID=A0A9D4RB10_DREPO|nr:hypothetical protein DPMN_024731 [Dreissena polymorpha]